MATYIYIKKSTDEATNILDQIKIIKGFQVNDLFIEEEKSVKELDNLLAKLSNEDVLIINSLNVIELSRNDMYKFFRFLKNHSIRLISVEDQVDTNKKDSKHFIDHCLVFIGAELRMRKNLKNNNLKSVSEIGRPKTSPDIVEHILFLRDKQKKSIRTIANECNVSIGTVHKYLTNR